MSMEIVDVTKTYGGRGGFKALSQVSIDLAPGNVMALIGQNGAGKTTLMKCILGLLQPEMGKIEVDGRTVRELLGQNGIGFMPENISNMGKITGREYIMNLMTLRGLEWKDLEERFESLLDNLYLHRHIDIPMSTCSKGNQKKIIFVQSVLHSPRMLILDEPTDGLDPISRKSMLKEINRFKDMNSYTIISTHLLSDIGVVADDIAVLQRGRVLSKTKVAELDEPIDDWYVNKILESGELDAL